MGTRTVPLTGTAATASPGTITAGSDVSVSLTGTAATTSIGTVTAAPSFALSGQGLTSTAGSLNAPSLSVALTGQSATASAGSMGSSGAPQPAYVSSSGFLVATVGQPVFLTATYSDIYIEA